METAAALNYRQSGKRVDFGVLHRGFVASPAAGATTKSAASIPSRFETVLNPLPKESRAFGSQAQRFGTTQGEHDLPGVGPGAYLPLPNMNKQSDSFSKKGYGNGFISKNQRFVLDYERIARPSPAAYDVPPSVCNTGARRPSSSLAGTASFLATGHPGADSVELRRAAAAVGPGTYDLQNAPQFNHLPKSSGVFRSTTSRFRQATATATPAPGAYEIAGTVNLPRNPGAHLRSHAERNTLPGLTDFPGVGEYSIPPLVGAPPTPYQSANFAPTTLDRFGRSARSTHSADFVARGPGAYTPTEAKSPYKGMVSVFASKTVRIADAATLAPGPAFYSPQYVTKKSFHLNTGKANVFVT